jgi:carbonic anhydrase
MLQSDDHADCCPCCGNLLSGALSRRRFIAAAGATLACAPSLAFAATGNYEAMVLSCIDPRLQDLVRRYLAGRHLSGKYSHFVIAGASVGVVAPAFQDWHKTFWDNLGASVQLHHIKRVIVINHRDCGAAKMAYGEEAVANRESEHATHRSALAQFRKQLAERHPNLKVETGLMALNGRLEMMV